MQVELYKFSKRINSTKRPVSGSGLTTQCTIKQNAPYVGTFGSSSDTTVCYPVLFLTNVDNPNAYNYCKTFGDRYYFIRDIQVDINGAATLHCEIDVLATRKTEILNSTQYVAYSSSDYDLKINDNRQPFFKTLSQQSSTAPLAWTYNENDPLFVVSAISFNRPLPCVYMLDSVESGHLADWLVDPANLTFLDEIRNFVFAPAEAIMAINVTGLDITIAAQTVQVTLGQIGTTAYGQLAKYNDVRYERHHVDLGLGLNELDYTFSEQCSVYSIELPFCGIYELPADAIYDYAKDDGDLSFSVDYYISVSTGEIVGFVYLGTSTRKILSFSGNCFSRLPWGTNGDGNIAGLKVLASTIIGATTFGLGASAIINTGSAGVLAAAATSTKVQPGTFYHGSMGASSSINFGAFGNEYLSGMQDTQPSLKSSGGNMTGYLGARPNYFEDIKIIRQYRKPIQSITEQRTLLGLPCNKTRQLSGLSGFCQCKNPSIEIDDLKIIAELINGYLSGGFFIE